MRQRPRVREKIHAKDRSKEKRKMNSSSWMLIKYLRPDNNTGGSVMKISTIVEHIRRRSKRNIIESQLVNEPASITAVESRNNIHLREKRLTNIPNISTRSLPEITKQIYDNKLAMFYRHPRLSAEEQQQQINQRTGEPRMFRQNRDEKSTSTESLYKPIFKECNDTRSASEVADLNIPPPRPKYVKRKKPYIPEIEQTREKFDLFPHKTSDVATADEPPLGIEKIVVPTGTYTETYVNLLHHQEEAKRQKSDSPMTKNNTLSRFDSAINVEYPRDIAPYNPDNIPYVEVPDYTDQREESLDEDDRRVAKKSYQQEANKTHPIDMDTVDPDSQAPSDVVLPTLDMRTTTTTTLPRNKVTSKTESTRDEAYEDRKVREKKPMAPYSDVLLVRKDRTGAQDKDETTKKASIENRKQDDDDDFPIIHFDINDYMKPFDFGKLLSGEEEDENYENEAQDFFTDDGSQDETVSDDHLPTTSFAQSNNPFENDTLFPSKPETHFFGDRDFFEPISKDERAKSDSFTSEIDFSSDDIIGKSGHVTRDDNESDESTGSVEPLEGTAKSEQKIPRPSKSPSGGYKNFWTLKYTFPAKIINDELATEATNTREDKINIKEPATIKPQLHEH